MTDILYIWYVDTYLKPLPLTWVKVTKIKTDFSNYLMDLNHGVGFEVTRIKLKVTEDAKDFSTMRHSVMLATDSFSSKVSQNIHKQ